MKKAIKQQNFRDGIGMKLLATFHWGCIFPIFDQYTKTHVLLISYFAILSYLDSCAFAADPLMIVSSSPFPTTEQPDDLE